MIRILHAVLRRYGRIADRKIARRHAGCGQFDFCTRCGAPRETDDDRCECGAPWQADVPHDQPRLF